VGRDKDGIVIMNQKQQQILDSFLVENPEYNHAKLDEHDGEVVVFFRHKPNDPFTAASFVDGSPTKRVLKRVNALLQEAADA
jgi:hypothetical protein